MTRVTPASQISTSLGEGKGQNSYQEKSTSPFSQKGGALNAAIQLLRAMYNTEEKPVSPNMNDIIKLIRQQGTKPTSQSTKEKITPIIHRYALISNAVYFNTERRKAIALDLGYDIDNDFETSRTMLWYDRKNKKTVVAFRGTKLSDPSDIRLDIALLLNKHQESDRFKTARLFIEAAIARYGKRGFNICGHSIGGSIAMYVARIYDVSAHVFNPGYSPISDVQRWLRNLSSSGNHETRDTGIGLSKAIRKRNKIHVYIVKGDTISNFILSKDDKNRKVYVFQNTQLHDPHYLGNFILPVLPTQSIK